MDTSFCNLFTILQSRYQYVSVQVNAFSMVIEASPASSDSELVGGRAAAFLGQKVSYVREPVLDAPGCLLRSGLDDHKLDDLRAQVQ